MDERLKQRLVGASVLVAAAVIFVPMLLDQDHEAPQHLERPVTPPPADGPARVVPLDSNTVAPAPTIEAAVPAPPAGTPERAAAPAPETKAVTSGFVVQLGSFSKAENARGLRDKLLANGYTAFVETTGSITRVYVGPQRDRAEAEKMLKKLLAETKLKGIVVEHSG